ncbi:hypothetical protein HanRHA438_Chr08g0346931 [Helianthus annuus]|nr:hypothetical protein HanRHA438_Chr08g0346931 [Helianthus annuus]
MNQTLVEQLKTARRKTLSSIYCCLSSTAEDPSTDHSKTDHLLKKALMNQVISA